MSKRLKVVSTSATRSPERAALHEAICTLADAREAESRGRAVIVRAQLLQKEAQAEWEATVAAETRGTGAANKLANALAAGRDVSLREFDTDQYGLTLARQQASDRSHTAQDALREIEFSHRTLEGAVRKAQDRVEAAINAVIAVPFRALLSEALAVHVAARIDDSGPSDRDGSNLFLKHGKPLEQPLGEFLTSYGVAGVAFHAPAIGRWRKVRAALRQDADAPVTLPQ